MRKALSVFRKSVRTAGVTMAMRLRLSVAGRLQKKRAPVSWTSSGRSSAVAALRKSVRRNGVATMTLSKLPRGMAREADTSVEVTASPESGLSWM
ncbi:MAG: hypothetical protein RLZZ458_3637 [Planctomycetota bacterium]